VLKLVTYAFDGTLF